MSIEKTSTKWRAVVYNGINPKTGKPIRITKSANSYREAKLIEADLKKKVALNFSSGFGVTDMTLNQYFLYFRENYQNQISEKTMETYTDNFVRISAALGEAKISRIEPKHILAFYQQLENAPRLDGKQGTISPRTIRKHHTVLSLLFKKAKQWQLILTNPMERVDPPKWNYESKIDIPDKDDLSHIFDCLKNENLKHRLWFSLSFATGIRRGELFGLQWQDIDFEKKTLFIRRSISTAGHTVKAKTTKTPSSTRVISVSDSILSLLQEYQKEYLAYYKQIVNTSIFQGCGKFSEEYLFITSTGRVGTPDGFNTWMAAFTKRYNLPKLTPHMLRHASASYLINSHVDIQTVSSRLGHSSTAVTQMVYSHTLRSAEQQSADVMEQIIHDVKNK